VPKKKNPNNEKKKKKKKLKKKKRPNFEVSPKASKVIEPALAHPDGVLQRQKT
jgi:hypothetical protein